MANRRSFLESTFSLGAGLFASRAVAETTHNESHTSSQVGASGGYRGTSSGSLSKVDTRGGAVRTTPVVTTDVGDLPYELDGVVKVFA